MLGRDLKPVCHSARGEVAGRGGRVDHNAIRQRSLDRRPATGSFEIMTATAFLELKQRASRLPERKRQCLSAYLIRLGQERSGWKQETARRLNEMASGKKVSVADLRKRLGHG